MEKKHVPHYLIFVAITIVALYVVKIFDISYPITITNTSHSSELAVVGEGKIEVVPDSAYVDVGITVDGLATTELAQKHIDNINNKIISEMKKLGIIKEDIKTTNYSINPNYKYTNDANIIDGYNGNATIQIRVKNIKMVARVISTATVSGANQIQGSRLVVSSPEKYREEVRDKAIANAREQAEKLAKKLGIKLGKITNIVESTGQPAYGYRTMMAEGIGGADVSQPEIEPGSQVITSTVTLYFEKK